MTGTTLNSLFITIHRGINQIGGCITEISTSRARILIDLGGNLPSNDGAADPLANKDAVESLTEGVDAIFYTHYHGDHVSLFPFVPEHIPQYIGEVALEVMKKLLARLATVSPEHKTALEAANRFRTYKAMETITVGDIRVTPFFTSHSALDAYMFLIEADGKRILHTGDFRGHGYLSRPLTDEDPDRNVLMKHIAPVDIVITEGTMLSRRSEGVMSEADLKQNLKEYMSDRKYVFVLCSSTDLDRLSSVYGATMAHLRPLVCDWYQKDVLLTASSLLGKKGPYYKFNGKYIKDFLGNLRMQHLGYLRDRGFCALIRTSHYDELKMLVNCLGPQNCHLIYSMWRGYYDGSVPGAVKPEILRLRSLFEPGNIKYLHTSGHADCKTLEKVLTTLSPREAIIGIHKDAGTSLTQLDLPEELKARIVPERYCPNYIKIVQCNSSLIL